MFQEIGPLAPRPHHSARTMAHIHHPDHSFTGGIWLPAPPCQVRAMGPGGQESCLATFLGTTPVCRGAGSRMNQAMCRVRHRSLVCRCVLQLHDEKAGRMNVSGPNPCKWVRDIWRVSVYQVSYQLSNPLGTINVLCKHGVFDAGIVGRIVPASATVLMDVRCCGCAGESDRPTISEVGHTIPPQR